MKRWILFVSRRFLGTRRSRGGGAGGLAIAGIAVGVATLIVVLSVMNGFQLGTIQNILEINSFHVRLQTGAGLDQIDRIQPVLSRLRAAPGVSAAIPDVEIQTLARGFWPEPQGIVIRAVPDDWLERDPGAERQLRISSGRFDVAQPDSVVLGAELARALGVRVGDQVAVTHIPAGGRRPAEVQLTVTGLFRSGYLEFDRGWAFVSLATGAGALEAQEPVTVGLKLDNRFRDAEFLREIAPLVPDEWSVETWREYNRGIFGALRVEKSMMVFLVALIFVVVAGNLFQLLRRSILERSEDIAILRALGAGPGDVRRIFVLEGWIIGVAGTAIGTLLGLLIAGNINGIFGLMERVAAIAGTGTGGVFSPSYFYIDRVPTHLSPREVMLVAAGAIGSAALSAWWAGRSVVRRMPMDLLRSE